MPREVEEEEKDFALPTYLCTYMGIRRAEIHGAEAHASAEIQSRAPLGVEVWDP